MPSPFVFLQRRGRQRASTRQPFFQCPITMARLPRCSAAGLLHLVELRWSADFTARVSTELLAALHRLLADAARRHSVDLHAYALGRSRALLLLTPKTGDGASRLVQDICRRLAAKARRSGAASGPLLAGRFRSTVLQPDRYLIDAMVYVEQLSARGGESAAESAWTSAPVHCGGVADPLVTDHPLYWLSGNTPFEREALHKRRLSEPLATEVRQQLDSAIHGGWPLGDEAFLRALAAQFDRPLIRRMPGRPRGSHPAAL